MANAAIVKAINLEDLGGLSSGLPKLDEILGPKEGIPVGQFAVFTGKYSSGKTTLAFAFLKQAQAEGRPCLFADAEQQFDPYYASKCGVNIKTLDVIRPTAAKKKGDGMILGEEILDAVEEYITDNENAFVVVDSVGKLITHEEFEKGNREETMSKRARLLNKALGKIKPLLLWKRGTMIVIGHTYAPIGQPMAKKRILAGGETLGRDMSVHIELSDWFGDTAPKMKLEDGTELKGKYVKAKLEKIKSGGVRYDECRLALMDGLGFNNDTDTFDTALIKELIRKEGNTYWYAKTKLGVGQAAARGRIESEPELKKKLQENLEALKAALEV